MCVAWMDPGRDVQRSDSRVQASEEKERARRGEAEGIDGRPCQGVAEMTRMQSEAARGKGAVCRGAAGWNAAEYALASDLIWPSRPHQPGLYKG